jgi:uncharacterized membrane protein YfcA
MTLQVLAVGLAIGTLFGLFGAGGSAFATPVLSLLGVPPVVAVASPLPAVIPAAIAGARTHLRAGNLDRRVAELAVLGGVPGTVLGALASSAVDGPGLLLLSGVLLFVIGLRLLLPDRAGQADRGADRRDRAPLVVAAAFGVGLVSGLLANGGGSLLVPMFVLLLGLSATRAAGTSVVTVGCLTVPTLVTHWALGHIDWTIALTFALGMLPGSVAGARLAGRVDARRARQAFAGVLVVFAAWFVARELLDW